MLRAYDEMFLRRAMSNMADMFDLAINGFGIPDEDFVRMFVGSEVCRRIENGEPAYIIGMCGEDVALRVIEETTGIVPEMSYEENYDRTPEHWCGWVCAYYQWLKGISYRELFSIIPVDELLSLYPLLHEADLSKFTDVIDEKRKQEKKETNLKRIRTAYGCSQSELARKSGVSLRSIQMYEQRRKDINKGQLWMVISLARALGCSAEDLIEA